MINQMIEDKKNNKEWQASDIKMVVDQYTNNKIDDQAMTNWLKCIVKYGMTNEEILALTKAQLESGSILDLSKIKGIKVDKHSTGGVGDKTTLIVTPLVASLGIPVAKMSGRALGYTGGTIDKLESIKGFNVNLSKEDFINQVNDIKIAITGQTPDLAPADKKIYALRDLTGTVKSIPLITASIMSKKLASGSDKIVLDVKFGNGAFCDTLEMAEELAMTMVNIGKLYGRETVAVITDMNQPLGMAIGNSIEVKEAINILKGKGPADLREISIILASEMVSLAMGIDPLFARQMVEVNIANGKAYEKFCEWIKVQGGHLRGLVKPMLEQTLQSKVNGYVAKINTQKLGELIMELGAGRKHKDDVIDYQVGIILQKKVGDLVKVGDLLMILRVANDITINVQDYFKFSDSPVTKLPLVYKIIK